MADRESKPVQASADLLKSAMQRDPALFQEVYRVLKSSQPASGLTLESTGDSLLDELFSPVRGNEANHSASRTTGDAFRLEGLGDASLDSSQLQLDVLHQDSMDAAIYADRFRLEAIVLDLSRPALPVRTTSWDEPVIDAIKQRLNAARAQLERCLPAVGRIDGAARMKGSGWLLSDDVLITNAHVVETFVTRAQSEFSFTFDEDVQFDNRDAPALKAAHQAEVVEVLALRPEGLDLAALRVKWHQRPHVVPLGFDASDLDESWDVAVIGYPEDDGRDGSFAELRYFQRVYQIKRLSPGKLLAVDDPNCFQHDCTTLGGSSGSPVINLATGQVIGLHCAGKKGVANVAIKAAQLQRVLRSIV